MSALLCAWHDLDDATVLAKPAPRVFRGDSNLRKWLWNETGTHVLDWEFAGHSDSAYDAAELIEHPSARIADDECWLRSLPAFGVDDRRFAATRRTVALRWLAVRWKRRHEDPVDSEHQLHRACALIGTRR